jgi:selenocysteine lyase/cysteine desulfurase
MPTIDVVAVRADTPACESVIHFNNAGSALPPDPVHDAVVAYLDLERRVGGYEAEAASSDRLNGFYTSFARVLNCEADEIAFAHSATHAWTQAFHALPFSPGDRILTARAEYVSNYFAFLQLRERLGISIDVVDNDADGQVDVGALESMIDERTKLIALTHVPTSGGLVNPAAAVGAIARRHGILYLLDACQSVGQMPVDVAAIGCDMLSGTGRKYLRGPRGTGFLYVRRSLLEALHPPVIDLHAATWTSLDTYKLRDDARRFESFEFSRAGKVGLATAVDYALTLGLDAIRERITALAAHLRDRLSAFPGVTVHDQGRERCGIVTFTKEDETPTDIRARLSRDHINISVSPLTMARLDFEGRGLDAVARASVHYYNTEDEIERFCATLSAA